MTYEPLVLEFEFRNQRFTDAAKGLSLFADEFEKDFKKTGPVLKKELRNFLDTVAAALAQRHGVGYPGGTTDNTLSKRSGGGIRSIKKSVNVTGRILDDIQGGIGGDFYLRIHETGGIIRAKRVQYLTIPLPTALNKNGTPKKLSAREWDKTFVATSKAGNLIIFQKRGRKIVPLYVLKKEVKIKPRLGMEKTLYVGIPRFVDKAMEAMLRAIMGVSRNA